MFCQCFILVLVLVEILILVTIAQDNFLAPKATVNFFCSDDITRYRANVEGITREGKECLESSGLQVDMKFQIN